jgi:hypothetical protein
MVTSYTTLLSSISGWLNSAQYDARIPEFIQMAEAHFNRELRVPQMEVTATSTATTESVTLPTDFLAARTVFSTTIPMSPWPQWRCHSFAMPTPTARRASRWPMRLAGRRSSLRPLLPMT